MNKEHEMENPLSKKVQKILSFDLDKDTLNSLKNVSELVTDNNLTTRRNLRANIEQQSLQINEKFIKAFNEAFKHLQVLGDQVNFIDESCQNMMTKIEELKFQTSDFLQQTSEVNSELQRLDINEKVLGQFINKFQLNQNEISLLTSNIEKNQSIDDRFFDVLQKIQSIHETSKRQLANNQYITGFEIMDSMSKYEEMADDKLYRWTICILRTINVDTIELHSHLFRAIAHLHRKDVLFKHCIDEYIIVRRSAVSHVFIEALTRGRTSNNTHYPAMERYSHDIIRYISDMLSFLHQTIVFEKDMLNSLLKYCDQEKLANQNTVKTTLASISEGLSRPLKIRIENSLISNNKTATVKLTTEKQNEKTKNYFLVKNVINFYQQIFGQILSDDAPFLYFIKEMLILSDKVFYNTLNFYCSSSSSNSGGPKIDKRFQDNIPQMINIGEHLNEYVQLINELLEIIKTSITTNENDQKLETHRLLSAMIDPFFQHTIIYSSKLSSIEMTIFSYNCSLLLSQTILKYKFTEDFVGNIEKQLDEYIDVLVNEQFQQIITNLSISSFYNAIIQSEQLTTTTPLVTFSGCDHIAISTFLKLFDKFVNNPQMYRMGQLVNVNDQSTREKIWEKSLYMVCSAYDSIHSALIDPKNNYDDVVNMITHKPDQIRIVLLKKI